MKQMDLCQFVRVDKMFVRNILNFMTITLSMPFCQSPFFIWFTGRSGSTFLCDLLNSHPQIHCREEDYGDIRINSIAEVDNNMRLIAGEGGLFFRRLCKPGMSIDDPSVEVAIEYLDELYSTNDFACGFKFKFPNQPLVFPEVDKYLRNVPEMKVVELCRRNVLKQAISLQNIPRIKKLGVSRGSNATVGVDLPPLELDIHLAIINAKFFMKTNEEFQNSVSDYPNVWPVSYEDLCTDTENTVRDVLAFLNVDSSCKLKSRFNKTTPDDLRQAIANFDELRDAVVGTSLERYLY